MKTVQDYLDLGLVFVDGDKGYKHIIESFAWRNNEGVKPEYKGLIHAMFENVSIIQDVADSLSWGGSFNPIIKWRPVVLQSDDAKDSKDESFTLPIGIDSPELRGAFKSLKEHLENKPPFWNKSMSIFNCPCVAVNIETSKPTVSPKEDKPMKPVYTAEMHAKGELPPVGAECEALCMDAMNSKHVWTKAKILMHHDGNECAVYCIDAGVLRWADEFKPIAKTIKVNGFDVPAPMSENIKGGDRYFFPAPAIERYFQHTYWDGGDFDKLNLARGTIHKTQDAAIAHAKAMLGIDPNA